jgi:hypothetical protein
MVDWPGMGKANYAPYASDLILQQKENGEGYGVDPFNRSATKIWLSQCYDGSKFRQSRRSGLQVHRLS